MLQPRRRGDNNKKGSKNPINCNFICLLFSDYVTPETEREYFWAQRRIWFIVQHIFL